MNVRSRVRGTNEHQTGHVQVEISCIKLLLNFRYKSSRMNHALQMMQMQNRSMGGVEQQYRVFVPKRVWCGGSPKPGSGQL